MEVRTTGGEPGAVHRLLSQRLHVQPHVLRVEIGATTQLLRTAVRVGDPIGHAQCNCFGSVGCFLLGGVRRIVSNRHVLALRGERSKGDAVIDAYGRLVGTVEFVAPFRHPAIDVDLAVARAIDDVDLHANAWMTPGAPAPRGHVWKRGAKTGTTHGIVVSTHYSVVVEIEGVLRKFLGQIAIESTNGAPFSDAGDSGSLVCDSHRAATPVGLLFAGDTTGPTARRLTFANPFERVIAALPWTRTTPQ